MAARLSRQQIKDADDLPTTSVDVPEWNGCVLVRGMTAGERDRFDQEMLKAKQSGRPVASVRAALALTCVLNEDHSPMFELADLEWLQNKSGTAMDRIFDAVRGLSGMGEGATEQAAGN